MRQQSNIHTGEGHNIGDSIPLWGTTFTALTWEYPPGPGGFACRRPASLPLLPFRTTSRMFPLLLV